MEMTSDYQFLSYEHINENWCTPNDYRIYRGIIISFLVCCRSDRTRFGRNRTNNNVLQFLNLTL